MNFNIYKQGQGSYTRIGSALFLMVVFAGASFKLHTILRNLDFGEANFQVSQVIYYVVPVVFFGILGLLSFWIVNTSKVADFMINAEGEIKKVSWSSKREVILSTYIVILVVFLMTALLFVTDMFFQWIFREIGVLPRLAGMLF